MRMFQLDGMISSELTYKVCGSDMGYGFFNSHD